MEETTKGTLIERRIALVAANADTLGNMLATARARGVRDPVVMLLHCESDPLARDIARRIGALRPRAEDGTRAVAFAVVERATALRHVGPALAEEVETGLRTWADERPPLLCIAYGGATVGPAEAVAAQPADA